jgi:phospholipid/cholesterol/gamma-HCH transport system permease protein
MAVLLKNEPEGTFVSNLWNFTTPMDIASALIKTVVFGLLIGLISCYKGFYASGGAAGVGRAVNDTVVQAVLAIFAANYLLTSAFTVS